MSELGRYRKLYSRIWLDPRFMALTDTEKVVALYLLTGPQTNRLGLYRLSIAAAAEDLGGSREAMVRRVETVCDAFAWQFDAAARVVFIPTWLMWNPPDNANVMKGSLKDLNELPPSALLQAFTRSGAETLSGTLRETFLKGLRQRFPERSPNQDQYQEQKQKQYQEQEQEQEAGKAGATCGNVENAAVGHGLRRNGNGDGADSGAADQHRAIAREALRINGAGASETELLDGFYYVALHLFGVRCVVPKAAALAALREAQTAPTSP